MTKPQRYTGNSRAIVTALVLVAFLGTACTSMQFGDSTGSSTHSNAQQSSLPQQTARVNGNPVIEPLAVNNSGQNSLNAQRSGVVDQSRATVAQVPGAAPKLQNPVLQASISQTPLSTSETDAMANADPNSPESLAQQRVDQLYPSMQHASCEGGWATPPDGLDAKRVTPGHPYYIEMRLRNTPLLPVGHTYIAYGRLSPEGELLNENVVMLSPIGGYTGAAFAAALPMPGILKPVKDDCRIKPHAAYRISLTAEQFEQLLLRIQKAQRKIPAYALFAYNCNHFASDIAASVGILPPKNIYLPAVKYIYGVIEANEGFNPKRKS